MNSKTHVSWREMDNWENNRLSKLAIWFTSDYKIDIFVNCE